MPEKISPYEVHTLCHKDCLDFKTFTTRTFCKHLKQDDGTILKIRDIRSVRFNKNHENLLSITSLAEDSSKILINMEPSKRNRLTTGTDVSRAYKTRLSISTEKYQSLRKLCQRSNTRNV